MNYKFNIAGLLAAMTLLCTSCTDSFFDLEPNNQVPKDNLYKTAQDFEIAVNGCYAKLQSQVNFYMECCEYRSDNLNLNAPTSGTQDRYDICHFQEKPSNGILEDFWNSCDNEVYRCNLILDKIDAANFDASLKARYKAEALFLRAYTYFTMYRMWGGVPVARKVVSPDEALKVKRATEDEMFNYITGDLKEIINENMLPISFSGDNTGRITLGAVQTLLGKAYLTFKKPDLAAEVLKKVIGQYRLLDNPKDIFSVDNKMNGEEIFVVRFNKTIEGEGHGYWYSITNLTDDTNRTETLNNLYAENDKRKELLQYVKLPNVNVCLMNKFYDTQDAVTKTVGNDQVLLRYADVLLLYAEALNDISYDGSTTSEALRCLNEVHTRAGLDAIKITEVPDQSSFKHAILKERQKEFPYEGQRWFDLVRMGDAKNAIAASKGITIQDYQLLYPIPTSELERINNKDILWQNPGY